MSITVISVTIFRRKSTAFTVTLASLSSKKNVFSLRFENNYGSSIVPI